MITLIAFRRLLPRRSGIYGVWWGHWRYVGQSRNVWWRWNGPTPHHRISQVPPWAVLVFWPCPIARLDAEERIAIRTLRPSLNYTRVPRPHYLRRAWRQVLPLVALLCLIILWSFR